MDNMPSTVMPGRDIRLQAREGLQALTILEEEAPVIVRRRGCTLRVRISSDGEQDIAYNSDYGVPSSPGTGHVVSPLVTRSSSTSSTKDDLAPPNVLQKNLRLLRTLSEDMRGHRRRDSLPTSCLSSMAPHLTASQLILPAPSSAPHMDASTMIKMRKSGMGNSAPNLSESM
ncbi:hypothetical protein CAPTEDRAFT_185671, partial [Capitella teleta]